MTINTVTDVVTYARAGEVITFKNNALDAIYFHTDVNDDITTAGGTTI